MLLIFFNKHSDHVAILALSTFAFSQNQPRSLALLWLRFCVSQTLDSDIDSASVQLCMTTCKVRDASDASLVVGFFFLCFSYYLQISTYRYSTINHHHYVRQEHARTTTRMGKGTGKGSRRGMLFFYYYTF
jgi:hypothetical protein